MTYPICSFYRTDMDDYYTIICDVPVNYCKIYRRNAGMTSGIAIMIDFRSIARY